MLQKTAICDCADLAVLAQIHALLGDCFFNSQQRGVEEIHGAGWKNGYVTNLMISSEERSEKTDPYLHDDCVLTWGYHRRHGKKSCNRTRISSRARRRGEIQISTVLEKSAKKVDGPVVPVTS
jgi:hypothetical protein